MLHNYTFVPPTQGWPEFDQEGNIINGKKLASKRQEEGQEKERHEDQRTKSASDCRDVEETA